MMRIQRMTTKKEILYPELSYQIIGIAFDVHNELGQFAREKQYADLLEKKLREIGLNYKRELRIGDSGNIADFVVGSNNEILLELKTTRVVIRDHFRQIQNYLQVTGIDLGIIINFSDKYLKPKRVLRISTYS